MQPYSWVLAFARIIGLLLIGQTIPALVRSISNDITNYTEIWTYFTSGPMYAALVVVNQFAVFAPVILGFYLFFGGKAVSRWCLRNIDNTCPRCTYDLRGCNAPTCPECGLGRVPLNLPPTTTPATNEPSSPQ